ncbi:putative pentatricopeptide repeat-containing protein At1g12700, mitochondrial [Medicago truncatula]|uniref:putative pentatricopeptide repeat-containing protein At1g12700, mitochondrial n=1 Tax=Medicago truncatula TaxID=3880 RepID=UPI000D2F3628|nr:putative pentatricopeptide repeat-containing protein At1g12700, mitochondrial [Medicago truncatula]
MELQGIQTDVVNLSILINCFCHLHQLNYAFSVLAKIFKFGYQPDTITMTTLMKGLCLSGQVRKALHFHDDVIEKGFKLDHVSYGTLINGLCKSGETRAALQVLEKIERLNVKPDVLIDLEVDFGSEENASIVYAALAVAEPNPLIIFLVLVWFDKAITLLTKIKDQGIQPNLYTYTLLVDGICKNGKLKDAKAVYQDLLIKGYHLDVIMYNVMVNWLCKEGLFDEALSILSKMEHNNCTPDVVTYEIVIRALFKNVKNDKAVKLLCEMIDRGLL